MEILRKTIKILCGALDLDNEQRFYFLSKFLDENDPDKETLTNEFNSILNNSEFDLPKFISDNDELIENVELYNRQELESYMCMLLYDYIYPDKILLDNQILQLLRDVISVLKDYEKNEGWMYSYDLYNELKKVEIHKDLKYYNLWKLDFNASNIERKPIEEKYQEIGYLRYKEI